MRERAAWFQTASMARRCHPANLRLRRQMVVTEAPQSTLPWSICGWATAVVPKPRNLVPKPWNLAPKPWNPAPKPRNLNENPAPEELSGKKQHVGYCNLKRQFGDTAQRSGVWKNRFLHRIVRRNFTLSKFRASFSEPLPPQGAECAQKFILSPGTLGPWYWHQIRSIYFVVFWIQFVIFY